MDRPELGLRRDEDEDLVDYGDSDVETETDNNQAASMVDTVEDIDIFADDTTQPEGSTQEDDLRLVVEKSVMGDAATASASTGTTTKTPEAAVVIKTLSELLNDPTFRAALGLIEDGSTLDLGFWVDGLDIALSLKLVGAAQVKACKYGAACRSSKCTFDHGNASRTAGKKPRKLCSMINTPTGCPKGSACWFSHEAVGVACADGHLRATCVKGGYCVYKHNDDHVVASVETVKQPQVHVDGDDNINQLSTSIQIAHPIEPAGRTRPGRAPHVTVPGTTAFRKQQASGVKRRRESEDGAGREPGKIQRVDDSGSHGGREYCLERAGSENRQSHRSSGQDRTVARGGRSRRGGRGGRGGGRGGKGNTYGPSKSLIDRVTFA